MHVGMTTQVIQQNIAQPGIFHHIAQRRPLQLLAAHHRTAEMTAIRYLNLRDIRHVVAQRWSQAQLVIDTPTAIR